MRLKPGSQHRCSECRMLADLCICSELPQLELRTKLVLAMHIAEKNKPTNSGRILIRSVQGCQVRYQGIQSQPLDLSDFLDKGSPLYMLFPDGAHSAEDLVKANKPVTLIVPDGTWQQAKRIAHHISEHYKIPRVSVPQVEKGHYQLRSADREGRLSTLEATARVLGVLEGPAVQHDLERAFNLMVARVLESRQRSKRQ